MKYLLLLLVLATVFTQNTEPIPSCHTSLSGFNDLPVAVGEFQTYDIDYLFTGFNLNFTLSPEAPNFVHLTEKFEKVAEQNTSLKGLKNFHLESVNNTWGQSFILIMENNFTTTVKWGKMAAVDALPVFQGSVVVEEEANVDCFDAIRFNDQGVIMVDCAKRSGSNGSYVYSNRFMYVNMTNQTVMKTVVSNKLYTDFRHIAHRRFFRLTEDGYHYLIRVYFAQGVDQNSRNNTYMEIFTANDPMKPYILRVLDRSFLGQTQLAITDFKVYLGDLYILDYHQGLIKFDITPSQQIVISGRYRTDSGFLKFGIYSDDLNHEFILALANSHAIYEIDWTNQISPKVITKYSLMSGSRVDSVQVNNKFVVVQAEANVTSSHGFALIYNTTWVFSRNSRTFSHAYVAIPHDSYNTLVAFNMEFSYILTIDEEGLELFQVGIPILGIYPTDNSLLGKEYIFSVIATSTNPVTNESRGCTYTWKSIVVKADNYSLWETGFHPSSVYYANYPGGLEINLNMYVIGPNITYGVEEHTVDGELPQYMILQQNHSHFNFKTPLNINNITLLKTEQYNSVDDETIFMYIQDSTHRFWVQKCVTNAIAVEINCTQIYQTLMNNTMVNLTANRFHYYGGQYRHLAAAVTKENPYQVFINDVENGVIFNIIHLPQNFSGLITHIQFLGEFLVVTCKYSKAIYFYDMIRCEDHGVCDRPTFTIDTAMMKRLDVRYFAPLQVEVSDSHPYVLFIQNMDSVIIVDFSLSGLKLLGQINSPATKELGYNGWKMSINRESLVIVNAPDIIEEYTLRYLYDRRVIATRKYPLYNYTIPEKFDLDFSDNGDLIFITAQDKNTNEGKVLVYRAGYPTVMAFYDVFDMPGKYEDTIIEATGYFVDYVVMATGSKLSVFRQFAFPMLIIYDTFEDFTFNITYRNNETRHMLSTSQVKIANYPTGINITNQNLTNQTYLDSLVKYEDDERVYIINDKDWFNGTVINYTMSCESECGPNGKIELIDHVSITRKVHSSMGMYDYSFTAEGGVIQQSKGMTRMLHNGSIQGIINMPIVSMGEVCKRVSNDLMHGFIVSACEEDNEVLLYLTSQNSYKPFSMGPFLSSADHVTKIETMGNLLFITDVNENPHYIERQGAVFVYRINHDPSEAEAFDELEVIDSNDFLDTHGWGQERAFLGNSHIVWTNDSSLYRLLVTELNTGLFVVDFKWTNNRDEIVITKTNFINLKELLGNISMPLPNDAHFQAVTVVKEHYSDMDQYWLVDVVVSIRNFHNIQINMLIDKAGTVLDSRITHVYLRYSYYQASNYIKALDGYFVVNQKIPSFLESYDHYSKQILAVYDTRPNRTNPQYLIVNGTATNVETSYMLGGLVLNDTGDVTFDFNFTFRRNSSDPFSNISLVVVDSKGVDIDEVSISQYLKIVTHKGIKRTQNVKLVAQNDYHKIALPITIRVPGEHNKLPWWAILLIVLGSLAAAAVVAYFIWRYYQSKQSAVVEGAEVNKSLLEREAEEDVEGEEETTKVPVVEEQDVVEVSPVVNETVYIQPTQELEPKHIESVVSEPTPIVAIVPAPVSNPQTREGTINESIRDEESQ